MNQFWNQYGDQRIRLYRKNKITNMHSHPLFQSDLSLCQGVQLHRLVVRADPQLQAHLLRPPAQPGEQHVGGAAQLLHQLAGCGRLHLHAGIH